MVFKRCLKIAPRLSGSPMGVPLVPATELRAEEHLLAAETAKSVGYAVACSSYFWCTGKRCLMSVPGGKSTDESDRGILHFLPCSSMVLASI